jgi:hypothetical protein
MVVEALDDALDEVDASNAEIVPSQALRTHETSPPSSSAAISRSILGTTIFTWSSSNGISVKIRSRPSSPAAFARAPSNSENVDDDPAGDPRGVVVAANTSVAHDATINDVDGVG